MDMQATPSAAPDRRPPIITWLRKHRARLLFALRVLTAVILMGIIISLISGDWRQFANVDWRLIPFAFALTMISTVVKAMRWSLLVHQSRMHMSFRYLLGTYLIGAFFSTVLPTSVGGDAVRAVDAANKSGRIADATSSVLIERGIGLLVVIGSGSLFALLLEPNYVPIGFQVFVHLMFVAGLVGLLFLRQGWFIGPIAALLRRLKLVGLEHKVRSLQDAFSSHLWSPGIFVSMLVLSIVAHALTILATYIVLDAVTTTMPLGAFVPVIALTTAAELLPISIASLGVKESAYVFFLGLAKVGSVEATVIALIMRGLTLARAMTGGIVFLGRSWTSNKPQEPPLPPRDRGRRSGKKTRRRAQHAVEIPTSDARADKFANDDTVPLHTPIP